MIAYQKEFWVSISFWYLFENNGSSVNKEIDMLMKQAVLKYEQEHGLIEVPNLADWF